MECSPFRYPHHFRAGVLVLLLLIIMGILITRRRGACGPWDRDEYGARDHPSIGQFTYRDVHLDA